MTGLDASKRTVLERDGETSEATARIAMALASGRRRPPRRRRSATALLLVDVVNDLEFDGGEKLFAPARRMAAAASHLARRARAARVPVIYANDNFGHWQSNFAALVRHCLEDGVRGRPIVESLLPDPSDYFVLKPKQSAFFATVLETLLRELGVKRLVLAGLATDSCVLFTAHDAHMRGFELVVPRDAVASESAHANRWALDHMKRHAAADVRPARSIDWSRLCRRRGAGLT